ncbi:hypothetical protein B0T18DRAFT_20844 [Schizothecium vesticola]|uniref:Uncharacterized protein n=1 Tax=Schizothecium vesticola TaxID=314040 RepID=A0AA40KC16_9PEZI|nr:hypothetical protein B0T18DRAFT_20844 [Schizothecium vesticola]
MSHAPTTAEEYSSMERYLNDPTLEPLVHPLPTATNADALDWAAARVFFLPPLTASLVSRQFPLQGVDETIGFPPISNPVHWAWVQQDAVQAMQLMYPAPSAWPMNPVWLGLNQAQLPAGGPSEWLLDPTPVNQAPFPQIHQVETSINASGPICDKCNKTFSNAFSLKCYRGSACRVNNTSNTNTARKFRYDFCAAGTRGFKRPDHVDCHDPGHDIGLQLPAGS